MVGKEYQVQQASRVRIVFVVEIAEIASFS